MRAGRPRGKPPRTCDRKEDATPPTVPAPPVERLVYTIREAAAVLRISRTKLYELLTAGEIESVHIGRSRKIPAAALRAYIDRLRNAAPQHQETR